MIDTRKKCQSHLWLLTGTGEGYIFAKSLLKEGWKITVSVVSDRASIPYEKLNIEKILVGALISEDEIRSVILSARNNQTGFHCVIDLTHPFATKITPTISKVCKELGQPFIRYERAIDNVSNAFLIEKFSDLKINKTYAPIAVVKNINAETKSFVELACFKKNCINIVTKGKSFGLIGGISLSKRDEVEKYFDFVIEEHKKLSPDIKILEKYVSTKNEISQEKENRNSNSQQFPSMFL